MSDKNFSFIGKIIMGAVVGIVTLIVVLSFVALVFYSVISLYMYGISLVVDGFEFKGSLIALLPIFVFGAVGGAYGALNVEKN